MKFTKTALRYLSLGFFVSALLLSGFAVLSPDASSSQEQAGQVAQPAEDTSFSENIAVEDSAAEEADTSTPEQTNGTDTSEMASEEETPESENNPEEEEDSVDDAASTVIVINSGDPSSFASNQLRSQGIIDSSTEFNEFLEENDYTSQLRPGSYEVNSDMTFQEIAEVLMSGN